MRIDSRSPIDLLIQELTQEYHKKQRYPVPLRRLEDIKLMPCVY